MQPRDLWSPPVSEPYVSPDVSPIVTESIDTQPLVAPYQAGALNAAPTQPQLVTVDIQNQTQSETSAASYTESPQMTVSTASVLPQINESVPSVNHSGDFTTDQLIAQENARVGTFEHPLPTQSRRKKIIGAISTHRTILLIVLVNVLFLGAGTAFAMSAVHKVTGGTLASTASSSQTASVSKKSSGSAAGGTVSDENSNNSDSSADNEDNADTGSDDEEDSVDTDSANDEGDDDNSAATDEGDDDEGDTGTTDPGDDGTDNTVTPTPTPVPATPVASNPHKFTIASWNVKTDNTKNAGTEVLNLLTKSQIIGLQTLRTKAMRDSIKSKVICSSCAYSGYLAAYSGSDAGPSDLPIIWNKSAFALVGSGSNRKMSDAASSKTYSYAARYATWVKLQSKVNGKQFYIIDTHTMSPGESGGKPGKDTLLISRYQAHMTNLKALIAELQKSNVPIYLVGTFNVDYRYDRFGYTSYFPYTSFKSVGVRSSWDLMGLSGISGSVGTLSGGKRLIDYVFTWQRSDVTANAIAVATSTHGSDHYATYFTNTVK